MGQRIRHWAFAMLMVGCGPLAACKNHSTQYQEVVRVPYTAITLPHRDGWQEDPSLKVPGNEAGGTVLRLVQRSSVPGSPRIEVNLEPLAAPPSTLEAFVERNMSQMGQLEQAGRLRILHVDRQAIQIGTLPGVRVQHEFVMGSGSNQISLFQVSLFCLYDGRGVSVTASGRTELFHPQAAGIAFVLQGLTLGTSHGIDLGDAPVVDLGKVGSRKL